MMDNTATALKEEGNKAFSEGNYKDAELLYTRAYVACHSIHAA
jgi:hypothetical protein